MTRSMSKISDENAKSKLQGQRPRQYKWWDQKPKKGEWRGQTQLMKGLFNKSQQRQNHKDKIFNNKVIA